MKRSRFSEELSIGMLKEQEFGQNGRWATEKCLEY